MKKLYFIKTEGYNMLISVDENKECRYLTENEYFPYIPGDKDDAAETASKFLQDVTDDSGWEDDCTYEQLFEEFSIEILAETDADI